MAPQAASTESSTGPAARRARLLARRTELRHELERGAEAVRTLAELAAVDQAIRDFDSRLHAEQVENLVKVHEAMARLRACETTAEMIRAAPRELCDTCGFARALISRVRASLWVPLVLAGRADRPPVDDAFRAYLEQARIPLEHTLLETDLVRRRIAALVGDPARNPHMLREFVDASGSTPYVAAPITPGQHVIGLLHADRFGDPDPVGAPYRDMIRTFAEHFGLLYERTLLMERLIEQRSRLSNALARVADGIDDLYSHELELVRRGVAPPLSGLRDRAGVSRVDALLSLREREVLDHLATGATVADVARQLVVSEGTIKSHIKRIHRKLRVNNRAEAVAKYLRLVAIHEERSR
jgi:DNA-binding CsgD family transcriptional regulator